MTEYRPRPGEVDAILRRGARVRAWHAGLAGLACAVVAAFVVVPEIGGTAAVVSPVTSPSATPPAPAAADRPAAPVAAPSRPAPGSASPSATASAPPVGPAVPSPTASATAPLRCAAGHNGGATDRGVTASAIRLYSTTGSGVFASGRDRRLAAEALLDGANAAGGICGRMLDAEYVDEGVAPGEGARRLRAAMAGDTFAVPFIGNPESLAEVDDSGDVDRTRTPVVGLPVGDSRFQRSGWIWPVAVADRNAARIMARDAYRRGARTFAVVFDDPAVGRAYDQEVLRLTGRHVEGYAPGTGCRAHYCGPDRTSSARRDLYADPPDFVALLVTVMDALEWMQDPATPPASDARVPYGHATTDAFLGAGVSQCGSRCHGMHAWSAYRLSCGAYRDDPAVREYENALKAAGAERTAATAAVWAGTQLLLDALRQAGPALTRDRLKRVLDTATLRVPLTVEGTVSFAGGGNRTMRAYEIRYQGTPGPCGLGPVGRV